MATIIDDRATQANSYREMGFVLGVLFILLFVYLLFTYAVPFLTAPQTPQTAVLQQSEGHVGPVQ
jgi:hypothetical protein